MDDVSPVRQTDRLYSLPDILRSGVLPARISSDGVSNGILPVTNNDANLIFFVFIGIFPTLTRKALGAVCPLYGSINTLHHGISSCFSTSSSRQDTQSDTCKTGAARLRVRPFELVEMVLEHGHRQAGPQLVLGAQTGAGAVLLGLLGIIPEHQMRVSP